METHPLAPKLDSPVGLPPARLHNTDGLEEFKGADGTVNGVIYDRPAFAYVEVSLADSEEIIADGGAMIWMDSEIRVETTMGSCISACKRDCSNESCCLNHYKGPGKISFAMKIPGDVLPFGVTDGKGWLCNTGSFLCGTRNLDVSSTFTGCRACCSGEGLFFTKITTKDDRPGMFYGGGYGALTRHDVPAGKTFLIDTGLFFACPEGTPISVGFAGGFKGCCCGGEGWLMSFEGPAVVYSQNRNPAIWKSVLNPNRKKKPRSDKTAAQN